MTHWVLLAALHLGTAQLQLGVREENRLGILPLVSDNFTLPNQQQGTTTTISAEIKPFLRLRLFAHGTEFLLNYQPQILFTEAFGQYNTLLLQSGSLSLAQRLARTLALAVSGSGAVGKLDFFRAQRYLQADTATVLTTPINSVVSYASLNGYAGLVKTIGKFAKAELGGIGLYSGPQPGEKTTLFFRRQTQAGATARYSQQVDRDNILAAEFEYRKVWFDHGPYYSAYTPALVWRHTGEKHFFLDSKIGAMFSTTEWGDQQIPQWFIGQGLLPPRTGFDHRIFPLFGIALSGFEIRRPGLDVRTNGTLNLLPFYDPISGVLQQRIGFGINNQLLFSRVWRGRVNLQVLIPAKWEYGHTQQPFIDQDLYAILNPALIRALGPLTYVEVGAYITQKMEDYTLSHWYQPQVVIYLAFQGQSTVW